MLKAEIEEVSSISIARVDHVVLTVKDPERTVKFYQRITGMMAHRFGSKNERFALKFGEQKLNLHRAGAEYEPLASYPSLGSMDICFITNTPLPLAMQHVREQGVIIEEGPVQRTGAIQSFYFRDPDGNLIEIANYPTTNRQGSLAQLCCSALLSGIATWAVGTLALLITEHSLNESHCVPPIAIAAGLLAAVGFSWCNSSSSMKINIKNSTTRFFTH